LQKDSDWAKTPLPKGWVYTTEEVSIGVKTEVIDPNQYLLTDTPIMCSKCKCLDDQLENLYRQLHRATSITKALLISPSASKVKMAVRQQHITSRFTSMPPIHL
jgi:SUMO ligase MMS21 Smc5/6 complex component